MVDADDGLPDRLSVLVQDDFAAVVHRRMVGIIVIREGQQLQGETGSMANQPGFLLGDDEAGVAEPEGAAGQIGQHEQDQAEMTDKGTQDKEPVFIGGQKMNAVVACLAYPKTALFQAAGRSGCEFSRRSGQVRQEGLAFGVQEESLRRPDLAALQVADDARPAIETADQDIQHQEKTGEEEPPGLEKGDRCGKSAEQAQAGDDQQQDDGQLQRSEKVPQPFQQIHY